MGLYFGTDGIRGIAFQELDGELSFKCGNALSKLGKNIVIGRDTRLSGDALKFAFISGFISGGGNVVDIGIASTPCVAYVTKNYNFDFGVVISASHNTSEYNGIKIFNKDGVKLGDKTEELLESYFNCVSYVSSNNSGKYIKSIKYVRYYVDFIIDGAKDLQGLKVGLDTSNGASYLIARRVFKKLNAKVYLTANKPDGVNINDNCGSTCIDNLVNFVKKKKLDIGFAFDGDADRVITVDKKGNVIDGDLMLYALTKQYLKENKLNVKTVVGTPYTNLGVQYALNKIGVKFICGDVGDKYVTALMNSDGCILGGEQSGHIIIADRHTTGDGVYTATKMCENYLSNKGIVYLNEIKRYEQFKINVPVKDKVRVLGSETVNEKIEIERKKLGKTGRIMVRASGTESLIRIFVETQKKDLAEKIARRIENVVKSVE